MTHTVLVTGGTGFLGSYVAEDLVAGEPTFFLVGPLLHCLIELDVRCCIPVVCQLDVVDIRLIRLEQDIGVGLCVNLECRDLQRVQCDRTAVIVLHEFTEDGATHLVLDNHLSEQSREILSNLSVDDGHVFEKLGEFILRGLGISGDVPTGLDDLGYEILDRAGYQRIRLVDAPVVLEFVFRAINAVVPPDRFGMGRLTSERLWLRRRIGRHQRRNLIACRASNASGVETSSKFGNP